ncbi:MAG: hypothetical protein ABIU97_10525, partial [Dehalococcoidia bacterium]
AVFEALRSIKPESPDWPRLAARLGDLEHKGRIRLGRVSRVAETEPARIRSAFRLLGAALASTSAA